MKKLFLLCLTFVLILSACGGPGDTYDELAQCLTEKGVKEYGTFWCPNCAKQKKMLGDAYQYIDYIECDPRGDDQQAELCIQKGIEKYPTWEFSDGTMLIGTQELNVLAETAGCPLPATTE
jgi:hypothetical protein